MYRDNNGVRKIIFVKNDPAAGPAPDQIAFARVISDISKFPKIPKWKSRGVPPIKTDRGEPYCLEQGFIDCHVHRRRARCGILANLKFGEDRHANLISFRVRPKSW